MARTSFMGRGAAVLLLAAAVFLSSCASVGGPSLPEVDPLALLSSDSSIYVYIPVKAHGTLVKDVVMSKFDGVNEKDASSLVQYIDTLFVGLGTVEDRSRLELAASHTLPSLFQTAVLTKKKGWTKTVYDSPSSEQALENGYPHRFNIYTNDDVGSSLSLPSSSVLVAGFHVEQMLDAYAKRLDVAENDCTSFLGRGGDDILFYITRPGQYLRNLIGSVVNISCENVYGTLRYVEDPVDASRYSGIYDLSFSITLSSARTMPVVQSLVSTAVSLIGGSARKTDDKVLLVENIEVSEKQIIDLFTRDPISGKHF